jgi:hypothetical protein
MPQRLTLLRSKSIKSMSVRCLRSGGATSISSAILREPRNAEHKMSVVSHSGHWLHMALVTHTNTLGCPSLQLVHDRCRWSSDAQNARGWKEVNQCPHYPHGGEPLYCFFRACHASTDEHSPLLVLGAHDRLDGHSRIPRPLQLSHTALSSKVGVGRWVFVWSVRVDAWRSDDGDNHGRVEHPFVHSHH